MRNKSVTTKKKTRRKLVGDTFEFQWVVSSAGYEVLESIDVTGPVYRLESSQGLPVVHQWHSQPVSGMFELECAKGPWLVELPQTSMSDGPKHYSAARYPNIHRDFALVLSPAKSVLRFAKKFGLLGRAVRFPNDRASGTKCEPLAHWILHASRVRQLLLVWQYCRNRTEKSAEDLRSMIDFGPRVALRVNPLSEGAIHSVFDSIAATEADMYVHEHLVKADPTFKLAENFCIFTLGMLLLKAELNRELADGVRPSVVPSAFGSGVKLVPRDLLGAIYASFAQETIGEDKARISCPVCDKWFIQVDIRQVTCSKACKQRLWRMNKDKERKDA